MTQYRELSEQEQTTLTHLRVLEGVCADLCLDVAANPNHDPRALAIATTQLQGAMMWLVRAHTNPTTAWSN